MSTSEFVLIERHVDGTRSVLASGKLDHVAVAVLRRCDPKFLQRIKGETVNRIQLEHHIATGVIPAPPTKPPTHE